MATKKMRGCTSTLFLMLIIVCSTGLADDESWESYNSALGKIESSVARTKSDIQKLLAAKEVSTDPAEKQQLMNDIAQAYKQLGRLSQDLDLKIDVGRYRFPNRGQEQKERYLRGKIQEVRELSKSEKSIDAVDSQLDELLALTSKQLGDEHLPQVEPQVELAKDEEAQKKRVPASVPNKQVPTSGPDNSKRIRLTK